MRTTELKCVLILHYIILHYITLQETLSVVLDIPKTGNFSLLVHHANTARQEVEVQIIVQYKNVSHHAPQREEIYNFSQSFPADNQTTKIITGYPSEYLLLKKGLWLINMTTTQPQGGLKLVRKGSSLNAFKSCITLSHTC